MIAAAKTEALQADQRKLQALPVLPETQSEKMDRMSRAIIKKEEYSFVALWMNSFKDICNAWSVLLFMLPVSMGVGYGYVFLLRYCARTVLNVVLAGLIIGTGSLSFYCLYYAEQYQSAAEQVLGKYTDSPKDWVFVTGAVSGLICFILLCAGYSMHYRMEKIAAVVEVAGDTMWSVQLLLCMPVLEVGVKLLYTLAWMFFASYVISNGDMSATYIDIGGHRLEGLIRTFRYSMAQKLMVMFYVVGYVWGVEFISMLFKFVVSYAVCIWYFQPCRADMSKTEVGPEVWRSGFQYALIYHVGSLCLGAVVVVLLYIFIPVNVVLEFAVNKTNPSQNPVVKAMVYSCTCCIKCTQEVVSYVNKGAIVEMVLRGDHDFFASAGSAMRVMRDADHSVMSLHGLTFIFQIVGLVSSATIGIFVTYWFTGTVNIFADEHSKYFLENRLGITVVAGIIAIAVSSVFMWTLDLVADSLLFCWLVEGEDDRTHQTFAPRTLRNVIRFDDVDLLKDSRMISGGGSYHEGSAYDSYGSPNRDIHGQGGHDRGSRDRDRDRDRDRPGSSGHLSSSGNRARH